LVKLQTGEWTSEANNTFARMINDRSVEMTVMGHNEGVTLVDLSRPPVTDISSDCPVSIRDALIFLEFAKFASAFSSPGVDKTTLPSRKFFRPIPPDPGHWVQAIITHIDNPMKFTVQIVSIKYMWLHDVVYIPKIHTGLYLQLCR
jgi:tudor domain-containing protein 1/4/6/7